LIEISNFSLLRLIYCSINIDNLESIWIAGFQAYYPQSAEPFHLCPYVKVKAIMMGCSFMTEGRRFNQVDNSVPQIDERDTLPIFQEEKFLLISHLAVGSVFNCIVSGMGLLVVVIFVFSPQELEGEWLQRVIESVKSWVRQGERELTNGRVVKIKRA
jgi:hypothetical protein